MKQIILAIVITQLVYASDSVDFFKQEKRLIPTLFRLCNMALIKEGITFGMLKGELADRGYDALVLVQLKSDYRTIEQRVRAMVQPTKDLPLHDEGTQKKDDNLVITCSDISSASPEVMIFYWNAQKSSLVNTSRKHRYWAYYLAATHGLHTTSFSETDKPYQLKNMVPSEIICLYHLIQQEQRKHGKTRLSEEKIGQLVKQVKMAV